LIALIAVVCRPLLAIAGRSRGIHRAGPLSNSVERLPMKPIPALLLLSLAIGSPIRADEPAPPSPLTLAQTLDAVLARYPSLAAAQAAVDSARGRTMQSEADRLPQISADAAYTYLSLRPYVSIPGISLYETIANSYEARVGVRQLLSDFGRTDALVALARTGEISARDALEQARSQLGYQTIQAYYGVLLLRSSVSVADEEIHALDEAFRISEKKFNGGTATRFDLLTTQVRLSNAHNHRTDARASLEKQESVLRQLLGCEPGAPLVLAGDFGVPGEPPDLSATIAAGLRNRPEMKLARDSAEGANQRLDAANREDRPTLAANAAAGVEDGQLPEMYASRGYVTAGVSVSVPIFTGQRITGQRIEARADLRAAQSRVDELHRTIVTDVSDALSDLKASIARLAESDALVAQAAEALNLAKTRYANGVITNFELLDAQSNARAAELARLQASYDCTIARHAVARACGEPPAP
jgi:outer membrane protein TolC